MVSDISILVTLTVPPQRYIARRGLVTVSDTTSSNPSDTMRERANVSGWRLWILLRMNRYHLSGVILVGVFAALVLLSFAGLSPFRTMVEDANALQNLFSSMIEPIITGVTLVVAIGQLVLSQELGAVGDQRDRMRDAMDFRQDVERRGRFTISPPEPAAFLRELIAAIEDNGERLRDAIDDKRDEQLRGEFEEYVTELDEHASSVQDQIEGAQFGTFDVIWVALNFNYSWKIYEARRLREEYSNSLSDDASDALDELIDTLTLFSPAREHFKTLYFQWELINLSRALLYAAVPSLVVVAGMLMYVDADAVVGATMGVDNLVLVASGAFTVSLIPFVVLLSYILRIATVAQRTLAMGPFVLRETERDSTSDSS